MKIFYKKDYLKVKKAYFAVVNLFNKAMKANKEAIAHLEEHLSQYEDVIKRQHKQIEELKLLRRKFNSAKGGFNTKINKLTKENEELKKKLEESMTGKYLVKKLPSQRTPNTLKTHLKSNAKTSSIVKKIYE